MLSVDCNFIARLDSRSSTVVAVDPKYFRPSEVDILVGDASKAKKELGWEPKISIDERINQVVRWTLENERWLKL